MTKAHLLVTVDGLKELIPEQVLVDITNRAETTIAEELKRKLNQSDKFNVDSILHSAILGLSEKIRTLVSRHMDDATKAMQSKFRFPPEGREIIKELFESEINKLITDAVNKGAAEAAKDLRATLNRDMMDLKDQLRKAAQDFINEAAANLETRIETLARTQFLAVLKEAKEAGL